MKRHIEEVSKWCYQGIWAVFTRWFLVPDRPPELPHGSGDDVRSFRPSAAFLQYLKFYFWFGLVALDSLFALGWLALTVAVPWLGVLISPLAIAIIVVPDVLAYIAIHLRYDTTWYLLSDRSLRIRRGIWIIQETTITYENIQNVSVRQGPVQRWFGIWDVYVETAGGAGSAAASENGALRPTHVGAIEGIDDPRSIRDLILSRLKQSRSAGLGDELEPRQVGAAGQWSDRHVRVLESIRDSVRVLASAG
jgi:membrane protein YdbS with pleckstrin-like domain